MSRQNTTSGLSGNQLKLCAIAAMALDHLAWTLWPGYAHKEWWILLIHIIGRLAAPVMWFMISEGYQYTHNFKKYLQRLFLFAFISHFAYNFCFGISMMQSADSTRRFCGAKRTRCGASGLN